MIGNIFQTLCALVILPYFLVNHAFASQLCGNEVYEEEYVVDHDMLDFDQEEKENKHTLHFSNGSIINLTTPIRKNDQDAQKIIVSKLDQNGILQNERELNDEDLAAHSIVSKLSTDKALVLSGSHLFIFNSSGEILHKHLIKNDDYHVYVERIQKLKSGSAIVLGSLDHKSTNELGGGFVMKISATGKELWKKEFSEIFSKYPEFLHEKMNNNIQIITSGAAMENENYRRRTGIIELNSAGEGVFQRQYTNGFSDYLSSIAELPNGNFVVKGTTRKNHAHEKGGSKKLWLLILNEQSEIIRETILDIQPDTVVAEGNYGLAVSETGNISVSWAIQNSKMNDAQHQKCTYLFEQNGRIVKNH